MLKLKNVLKLVVFGLLTCLCVVFIIHGCTKQAKAEIIRDESNYYEIDITIRSEEKGMFLIDDTYGDMEWFLANDKYNFISALTGTSWVSSYDSVNGYVTLNMEIDFNKNTFNIGLKDFYIILDGSFVNAMVDLSYSVFDGAIQQYTESIQVDFGDDIGFYNPTLGCGFIVYSPYKYNVEGIYIPTTFYNEYDKQGIRFEYLNYDFDNMINEYTELSWQFGTQNYGTSETSISYRDSTGSGDESTTIYDVGVQDGIDRVKIDPNKFGLWTEEQKNLWGDIRYAQAMNDNENFTGSWFLHIFEGLSAVFNIKIFGEITLGMIALVPFSIEFLLVIFKIVRGGD